MNRNVETSRKHDAAESPELKECLSRVASAVFASPRVRARTHALRRFGHDGGARFEESAFARIFTGMAVSFGWGLAAVRQQPRRLNSRSDVDCAGHRGLVRVAAKAYGLASGFRNSSCDEGTPIKVAISRIELSLGIILVSLKAPGSQPSAERRVPPTPPPKRRNRQGTNRLLPYLLRLPFFLIPVGLAPITKSIRAAFKRCAVSLSERGGRP